MKLRVHDKLIMLNYAIYFECFCLQVFFDDPSSVNLTLSNMTRVYSTNYTVRVYTSSCLFFNTLTDTWDTDGCTVSNESSHS